MRGRMEGSVVLMILNDVGKLILALWKGSIPLFVFGVGIFIWQWDSMYL